MSVTSISDAYSIFATLLSIRLVNASFLRTFFQPDEYYQALEPAWNLVASPSGAWITWEWTQHLRSAIHPALFSLVYYFTDVLAQVTHRQGMRDALMIIAPGTAQAVVAAIGDFYTWKLARKVYRNSDLSTTTLLLTIVSPWQWFCSTRAFSNSLESALTIAALYYWPYEWNKTNKPPQPSANEKSSTNKPTETPQTRTAANLRASLLLAATATTLRPTNLLIWIVLALLAVSQPSQDSSRGKKQPHDASKNVDNSISILSDLAREGILCGTIVLTLSAIIDRAFYGTWTFPALNFLYFNVVQSLAVFYGNNDWHYYLSQGYPLLLTTVLPFAIIGLYKVFVNAQSFQNLDPYTRSSLRQLAIISIALPAALSVLSHKEVRFIYPVLGPLHVVAAKPVFDFFEPILVERPRASQPSFSTLATRTSMLTLVVLLNMLIASYTGLIHNSGLIALPEYLRKEFTTHYLSHPASKQQNMTVAILMPCHSTPWRSHLLHPPSSSTPGIQAWALTCEPPLHLTNAADKASYLDVADIFYTNPTLWLRKNMSRRPPRDFVNPTTNGPPPSQPPNHRNKHLWTDIPSTTPTTGLDITDLLPHLRTSPSHGPQTDTLLRRPWPHYLAFFAQLEPSMTQALRGSGYAECWRVFNSHWHDDWRRTGDVVVWCLFPERARAARDWRGKEAKLIPKKVDELEEEEEAEQRTVPERPGKQRVIRPGEI